MSRLGPLGWKMYDALKANQPRRFQELETSGHLEPYLAKKEARVHAQLVSLMDQEGYQQWEAEEVLRDQMYPPLEAPLRPSKSADLNPSQSKPVPAPVTTAPPVPRVAKPDTTGSSSPATTSSPAAPRPNIEPTSPLSGY